MTKYKGQAPILIYQNRESAIIMNNYRDISIRGDDGRRDGRSIRGKYKYKGTTDDGRRIGRV